MVSLSQDMQAVYGIRAGITTLRSLKGSGKEVIDD